jgi:hypothetical protein
LANVVGKVVGHCVPLHLFIRSDLANVSAISISVCYVAL